MIYCVSDLHGRYDRYMQLIKELKEDDRLIVLGDCIDRHEDGVAIIQDIMTRPNVDLILGNHEYMMLNALGSLVNDFTQLDKVYNSDDFELWTCGNNGGYITFRTLIETNSLLDVYNYIVNNAYVFRIEEINGRRIYLGHGCVLTDYNKIGDTILLKDYIEKGYNQGYLFRSLWASPFTARNHSPICDYKDENINMWVFGHRFVQQFGDGSIYQLENIYDIDGGCALPKTEKSSAILLCLDTMQVKYIR